MDVSSEQSEYLAGHQWAVLSTGRKDGSPQASMIGYAWDGKEAIVTFRRTSAKRHNIARQPRVVLLVPDGRRALTLYGDAQLIEEDPGRVDGFETIMASFGAPPAPRDEMIKRLDDEARVIVRIRPTNVTLQD